MRHEADMASDSIALTGGVFEMIRDPSLLDGFVQLRSADTLAINLDAGNYFAVTLDRNATIANPTGSAPSEEFTIEVFQPTGTVYVPVWGSAYEFDGGAFTPPSSILGRWSITFVWCADTGKAHEVERATDVYSTADVLGHELDPRDIFGSGLRVWWRPDASTLTFVGGDVSAIADQSGNGFNGANGQARPTYDATGGPNGTPRLVLHGAELDGMGADLSSALGVGDLVSCFLVLSVPNIATTPISQKRVLGWEGNRFQIFDDGTGQLTFYGQNIGNPGQPVHSSGLGFSDANPHSIAIVANANGADWDVYVDRGARSFPTPSGPLLPLTEPLGQGYVGAGNAAGSNHDVNLSEIAFVRGAPTANQLALWWSYVSRRYGI